MKKHSLHKPNLSFEVVDPSAVNETVQGAAITVRDLLQRLVLGDLDSAGFIKPRYEYEVNDPNSIATDEQFDQCDGLDVFGLTMAEAVQLRNASLNTHKREQEAAASNGSKHGESEEEKATGEVVDATKQPSDQTPA